LARRLGTLFVEKVEKMETEKQGVGTEKYPKNVAEAILKLAAKVDDVWKESKNEI
jgi:hypothetical protein